MYESDIESNKRKQAKKKGALLLKFVSPGISGVPDDLELSPIINKRHREIVEKYIKFIEFKRKGKEPSTRQKRVIKQLANLGYKTEIVDKK